MADSKEVQAILDRGKITADDVLELRHRGARQNAAMERRKARRLRKKTPTNKDVAPSGAPSPSCM